MYTLASRIDLVLVAALLCASGTSASGQVAAAPTSGLVGTVLSSPGDRPVRNAEIAIAALAISVRTDSSGDFAIRQVPAGTYDLTIRALGYAPVISSLTFHANETMARDFFVKVAVNTLARVEVSADAAPRPNMRLAEFEERRKMGMGHFFTQDVL